MKLRRHGKLFKPGLFLLAGAIVNVAVAWGLSIAGTTSRYVGFLRGSGTSFITDPRNDESTLLEWRAGLPFRSLGGFYHRDSNLEFWTESWLDNSDYWLPLRPLWPGFAINTIFYAAILWGLFAAPGTVRRRSRIRRGLCPRCAYDMRAMRSDACPECGAKR